MQAGPYASPDPAQEGSGLGPAVSRQPVRPPSPGPVGVSALLAAVRAVPGVRDAQVRTSADGDRTLRLDLADGADGSDGRRPSSRRSWTSGSAWWSTRAGRSWWRTRPATSSSSRLR